jgi:hypothetical protein
MRQVRIAMVMAVAGILLLLEPPQGVQATPVGLPVFSVSSIGPAHDISPGVLGGDTCTSADVLLPPILPPGCPPRTAPAPPGPVPDSITSAVPNLGLNSIAKDDLDALSFGETRGLTPITDYDFSVDPVPAQGGVTVGAPVPAWCPAVPNVTTEAAGLEAHGDIFTSLGVPTGCNQVAPSRCPAMVPCDEAALGLIAPNPLAPGTPPLDNVDAIAELGAEAGGPCDDWGPGICPAMSLTAGSPTIGIAPADTFSLLAPNAATIFVPPPAEANPPNLTTGCPAGGTACAAVHSSSLGLMPTDELDALCWFDLNGDNTVDLPTTIAPTGDTYMFSLAPGSPTLVGLGYSPADILSLSATGPVVSVPALALGLLPTDNIDGLTCHLATTDSDGDGFTDIAEEGAPLCAGAASEDSFEDSVVNDGCPALQAAEAACMDAVDSDGDTLINDGCPTFFGFSEGSSNIGTSGFGRCGEGAGEPSGSWPLDFVSGGTPESTDAVTITDLTSFLAPIRRFDTSPISPGFSERWDLKPGPIFSSVWIAIDDLATMIAGPTGSPPMPPYLGTRAFMSSMDCFDP